MPQDFSEILSSTAPARVSELSYWRPVLFGVAALVFLCIGATLLLPALSSPQYRSASLTGSPAKRAAHREPVPKAELRKSKQSFAEAESKPATAPEPAPEALGRVTDKMANLEAKAALKNDLALNEKLKKALEPNAPAEPVAAAATLLLRRARPQAPSAARR